MTPLRDGHDGAPAGNDPVPADESGRWRALAQRIAQGDPAAEAEFAQLFHAQVRVFASARLRGADAALDVAQETMVAVLEALRAGGLREPFSLPGFVLGTARNLVNNYHRKQARSAEVFADSPDRPALGNPEWAGLNKERRVLVARALARLGDLDRRILLLTLVEGMKPREIAPVVGLKPDVVRTRKARAVRAVVDDIEGATRTRPPNHVPESGRTPGGGT